MTTERESMSPAKPKNKPSETGKPAVDELSYEQALAELEKIVAALEENKPSEAGRLSLEEAMAL
jgi:exonuclease VII small subunit